MRTTFFVEGLLQLLPSTIELGLKTAFGGSSFLHISAFECYHKLIKVEIIIEVSGFRNVFYLYRIRVV